VGLSLATVVTHTRLFNNDILLFYSSPLPNQRPSYDNFSFWFPTSVYHVIVKGYSVSFVVEAVSRDVEDRIST